MEKEYFFKYVNMNSKSLYYHFILMTYNDISLNSNNLHKSYFTNAHLSIFKHDVLFEKYGVVSKIYSIDNGISELLKDTEVEFEDITLNLPFDNIFIENEIEFKDYLIKGIIVTLTKKFTNVEDLLFSLMILDKKINEVKLFKFHEINFKKHILEYPKDEIELIYFMRKYFNNFLNLLNSESEIENIEFKYNEIELKKTNEKRMSKNKYPFSNYNIIKPFGKLKIYTQKYLQDKTQFKYKHSFFVKGHWRNLKSQRYRIATNKKIWILPYKKGEGLLVEKTTKIEK